MKYDCEVIKDLLPLYLDEVCSEESKQMIEQHMSECESCRSVMEHMRDGQQEFLPEIPKSEVVLKKTAWTMSKHAVWSAIGITGIILYWLVYFWQDALSNIGDYRFFPYQFHELYTAGILLVPLVTLVWLGALFCTSVKEHSWRKNGAVLLILLTLFLVQGGCIYNQTSKSLVACWTDVKEIQDEYHIVIERGGERVVLETNPMVTNLLLTDGTMYGFEYEYNKQVPQKGVLLYVYGSEESVD